MGGNRKDSSKIALNVDLHLALHRRQNDLVHQRAQDVRRFDPLLFFFVLQGFVELLDPLAILQRHRRVQQGRRFLSLGQERSQLRFPSFQPLHVLHDCFDRPASLDGGQQLRQFTLGPFDLGLGRGNTRTALHA
ncbi:hypothetical protein [Agrobacterium tumefaciens]|uniref:hypothetical protein n=1 Tax=Agrobacterium tumefaciens TaxID=358 RepID=UPI0030135BD2